MRKALATTILAAVASCADISGLSGGAADAGPDASPDAATDGAPPDGSLRDAPDDAADGADSGATPVLVDRHPTAGQALTQLTFNVSIAAGDFLVIAVAATENAPASIGGASTTWTRVAASGTHINTSLWTATAKAAASIVVANWSTQQTSVAALFTEWTGITTFTDQISAAGIGAAITPGSLAGGGGQLLFALAGTHNFATSSPTSGFMMLDTSVTGDCQLLTAYRFATTDAVYTLSWNEPGAPSGWDAILASLR